MLKLTFIGSVFLINSLIGYSQAINFNGDYKSQKTSFQDINNTDNCFVEDVINNIFIQIDENNGVFTFQDVRLPNNILSYKIESFMGRINDGKNEIYTYDCTLLNSKPAKKKELIILYTNKNDNFNIMISDTSSSQVFFDLIKQ